MNGPILLCAATLVEARACRAAAERNAGFEVLRTGMGPKRAREALSARLNRSELPRPSLVLSTGFAGCSVEGVAVGDWIAGASLDGRPLELSYLKEWLESARLRYHFVPHRAADSVVKLERNVPSAFDMESSALGAVTAEAGCPFQILRLASDTPDSPLPSSIASFAEGSLSGILRGSRAVLGSPLETARFLARGSKLPGRLADGWKALSASLPARG